MPPASKIASKRKPTNAEESEPAAGDSKKVARVEDDSDAEMSPEEMAKKMFAANASKPAPEVKHSSSGGGSVNIEGVVTRASKISVQGKSGPVPKMQITIVATKIFATGTNSVINTNIDGIAFGLPTKQLEASPEEIAKDANAKGPIIIDIDDGNSKANFLGTISASFYLEPGAGKGAASKSKLAETPSVEACVPGTYVLVTGVSCSFGKTGTGNLYTNAKKITPLQGVVQPGMAAANVINHLSSASAQQTSAFLLSATVGGFFDTTYTEPANAKQAAVFKTKWADFVESALTKCETLASVYSSTDKTVSTALSAHAARIKEISAEEAAQGAALFNVDLQKDCITPYVAAIVQRGCSPGSVLHGQCADLFDAKKRDSLPPMFCDGKVVGVQFRGNLAQVDYRLSVVGDKDAAIADIKEGKMPVLQFENPTVSVKMSLRSVGPEVVGSLIKSKIEMCLQELMPYMNHVSLASVFPRSSTANTVDGHFTTTAGFDVANGIAKVGAQISKKWLDKEMLGGRGVLIHKVPDDVEVIEPASGIAPAPVLSKAGYQAVSEGSFDFDSLTAPEGKNIEFYVIYSGCATNVANKPSIATSVDDGEDHLSDIVPSMREDGDIKAFLKENAIVYAIAV